MQNIQGQDFFKPSYYNFETKNQIWCSIITDAHDNICCCDHPFAHLLSTIFPAGHTDRDLTINQILERDYKQICHSGGREEKDTGMATGTGAATTEKQEEEDLFTENKEDIEQLLSAAADAEKKVRKKKKNYNHLNNGNQTVLENVKLKE